MSSRSERLSIIVPVFNEARTVRAVIDRLLTIDLPVPREILLVDDGSTDGTGEVLESAAGEGLKVTVIRMPQNGGKGSAIRAGLARATGTIIAIQDADLELDPAQLAALVKPIVSGTASVVYGSRFLDGTSRAPRMTIAGNRMLTAATNVLYGSAITDMETCYKIMRAEIAHSLNLTASRFDIEPQITARLLLGGHRIHELPVRFAPRSRAEGKKIKWRDGVRALQVLLIERLRGAQGTKTNYQRSVRRRVAFEVSHARTSLMASAAHASHEFSRRFFAGRRASGSLSPTPTKIRRWQESGRSSSTVMAFVRHDPVVRRMAM